MGYKLKLRETVQSQINYQKINMLPQESEDDGSLSCTNCRYDDCMYSAVTDHMVKSSGCTVPWVLNNDKICTEPDKVNNTFYIAWNRITNQKRDCSSPCQVSTYSTSIVNE